MLEGSFRMKVLHEVHTVGFKEVTSFHINWTLQ